MTKTIKRLLVGNRGEIAVRIIRAARAAGIETVAIYSDADAGALHTRLADYRISLGGVSARDSYLNLEKIINATIQSDSDAVHPGYGFFAENAEFAEAIRREGIVYIAPSTEAIRLLGDKDQARQLATKHGVPVVPGTEAITSSGEAMLKEVRDFAEEVGYPVLLKAVAGGSGRGMRVVREAGELADRVQEASSEAQAAFANGALIVEKYLERPRHIEVQIFGDIVGNIVHMGERECSLQRRHQKVVEESPAPNLHPNLRERICEAAVAMGQAVGYIGAGTVEFLVEGGLSEEDPFYMLEVNTRIQVEHPVTEVVTGIDLVTLQLQVAEGRPLGYRQDEIVAHGHAIEFRIAAENPSQGFTPTTGTIQYLSRFGGPNVREDGWIEAGTEVTPYYDALLSKVIVSGHDRGEAIKRSKTVLAEYVLEGIETTLGFHRWLLEERDYLRGEVDVKWIERNYRGEVVHPHAVGPLVLPPPRKVSAVPARPRLGKKKRK